MELIKLCPACGEQNPVSEIICRVCMTNLSSVSPAPSGEKEKPANEPAPSAESAAGQSDLTIVAPSEKITFRFADGSAVSVTSGCVLGRSGEAASAFDSFRTVSRRHARVELRGGVWYAEDLSSTNGTWINGRRAEAGQPCPIKPGDTVALSRACELKVEL
jgi:hypothetical protein